MIINKIVILGGAFNEIKNFRLSLISQMVLDGFDVYVLSLDYTEADKSLIRSVGANPVSYPGKRGGLNPFREFLNFIKLIRIINRISPDFLFSYFTKQVILAGILVHFLPVKVTIGLIEGLGYGFGHEFGSTADRAKRFLIKNLQIALYNISLYKHSRVLFLNADDPVDLYRCQIFKPNNFEVIGPIGVNLAQLSPLQFPSFNEIRFIFVGRLLIEKGIIQFIKAAELIKSRHANVKFTVLGGIDSENPNCIYRKELDAAIGNGLIVYPGHVHDPWEWISNSHVFVLPSFYREGFPRSIQEAMALGRPVITTMSVGCRESVTDGFDGLLATPRSSESLAEKMLYFINTPELIKIFGANARMSAEERFDEDKFNRRVLDFFH
jgi:glycosyltransferase involved in cell wall biosynthesis